MRIFEDIFCFGRLHCVEDATRGRDSVNVRLTRSSTCPEGTKGLSLGFQPQVRIAPTQRVEDAEGERETFGIGPVLVRKSILAPPSVRSGFWISTYAEKNPERFSTDVHRIKRMLAALDKRSLFRCCKVFCGKPKGERLIVTRQ